jgi:hypothetical protein
MSHPIHGVVTAELVAPHVLLVRFDDGAIRTIDFRPALAGPLFGPLTDPDVFAEFRLDPETRTLVWPNGADFDPATLHDWHEHLAEIVAAAERWRLRSTGR